MGLYITVIANKKCPKCGNKKLDWQSKFIVDKLGYCLETWQSVKLKDIKQGEMYTICYACNHWIEYEIKNGKLINEKTKKGRFL